MQYAQNAPRKAVDSVFKWTWKPFISSTGCTNVLSVKNTQMNAVDSVSLGLDEYDDFAIHG